MVSSSGANKLTETESTHTRLRAHTHTRDHASAIHTVGTHTVYTQPNIHTQRHRDDENAGLRLDPSIPRSLHYLIEAIYSTEVISPALDLI